jgi:hypothetical protein
MEKATEVIPHRMWSWVKELSSLSARISNSLQEASSEPVAKASPLGKNLYARKYREVPRTTQDILDSVNVGLVPYKGLCSFAASDIPELGSGVAGTGDKDILVRTERQTE